MKVCQNVYFYSAQARACARTRTRIPRTRTRTHCTRTRIAASDRVSRTSRSRARTILHGVKAARVIVRVLHRRIPAHSQLALCAHSKTFRMYYSWLVSRTSRIFADCTYACSRTEFAASWSHSPRSSNS